jgi:hypothetical protein
LGSVWGMCDTVSCFECCDFEWWVHPELVWDFDIFSCLYFVMLLCVCCREWFINMFSYQFKCVIHCFDPFNTLLITCDVNCDVFVVFCFICFCFCF